MNIKDIYGRGYAGDRVGLELELESSKSQPLGWVDKQTMWTVHNDGSLRQNGVEYVFANPLWGGDIDAALQLFEDNTKGVNFVDTGYGSTHVHYNVGNLLTTEVMSIVVGWSILEDAFLTVCKPSRDGNNFAQRFNVLNQLVNVLSTQYTSGGNRIERLFANMSQDYWKYANLNLATIRTFGTLEFRPYHSTWDIKEIRSWIDRLINFCKGMVAIGTPVQVLETADRDLEAFITKYAGVPATEQLIDLTRRNISTAFRLAYVVEDWENIKEMRANPPKKKKKSGYVNYGQDPSSGPRDEVEGLSADQIINDFVVPPRPRPIPTDNPFLTNTFIRAATRAGTGGGGGAAALMADTQRVQQETERLQAVERERERQRSEAAVTALTWGEAIERVTNGS